MSVLKSGIKKLLVANCEKKYISEVKSQNMDYDRWVRNLEKSEFDEDSTLSIQGNCLTIDLDGETFGSSSAKNDGELAKTTLLCQLVEVCDISNSSNCKTQYLVATPEMLPQVSKMLKKTENNVKTVIFKMYDGKIAKSAFKKFENKFTENKNLILIYSDEDFEDSEGRRHNPWYKPDWAPDDFLSYFYFGGMFAIDAKAMARVEADDEEDIYQYLYKLLLFNGAFDKHTDKEGVVGHVPSVLFHAAVSDGYERVSRLSLKNQLHERIGNELVSVIIPSKDHPEVLFRCLDSFINITKVPDNLSYEFIIVDNGSCETNKETIRSVLENYSDNNKIRMEYIYQPSIFNFSRMCNEGALHSKGSYLLFLNDDMEIADPVWLLRLMEKAVLPYAGAVGAKLLYPKATYSSGDVIQHAGITNLRIGPAHKLQFLSDSKDHYFGRNRYTHDMMGVTGACLLVKKSIFNEVGGFDEKLAVAFNDVDLCYAIFEKGYYNIERNDVFLYHHESLSRGDDAASKEKMLRLAKEKDYLYEKHQPLYGKDPFYNINLTTDMLETEYAPKYHYEVNLERPWAKVSDITETVKQAREDACVRVGMECAMDIYKWKYGVAKGKCDIPAKEDDLGFFFQGYTFVIGANNACYERMLLLENTESGRIYGIEVQVVRRPDIKANIPDQLNVDLTGYSARMKLDSVPSGNYRFGMYMKDCSSTQRLYNWSNWTLTVE